MKKKKTLTTALLIIAMIIILSAVTGYAEGSKELAENCGVMRPGLEYQGNKLAGVRREQIMQVYANEGETIALASSIKDSTLSANDTVCDIVLVTPSGEIITYTNTDEEGFIKDSDSEKLGPKIGANANDGGYVPHTCTATETGIYKVMFHSVSGDKVHNGTIPSSMSKNIDFASESLINAQAGKVAAWDISVVKADGTIVPGRTFAYYYAINMGTNKGSDMLCSTLYVLTDEGFIYKTNFNGMDPFGFMFSASNRGLINSKTNTSLYHSVETTSNGVEFKRSDYPFVNMANPTKSFSATDKFFKTFINEPSADLPGSILKTPSVPQAVENGEINFKGYDDNKVYLKSGGTFTFRIAQGNSASTAAVTMDFSKMWYKKSDVGTDGVIDKDAIVWQEEKPESATDEEYVNGGKVVLNSACAVGDNAIGWDGKDGNGNFLPAQTYNENGRNIPISIRAKAGEYHFVMLDVENNKNGVIIERLNGDDSAGDKFTVYYNNSTGNLVHSVEVSPEPSEAPQASPSATDGITPASVSLSSEASPEPSPEATAVAEPTATPQTISVPFILGDGMDYSETGVSSENGACVFNMSDGEHKQGGEKSAIDIWSYCSSDACLTTSNEVFEVVATDKSLVSGTAFYDYNGDGEYDPLDGDYLLKGATVTITNSANSADTFTATTDENGFYVFDKLTHDTTYTLTITSPLAGSSCTTNNITQEITTKNANETVPAKAVGFIVRRNYVANKVWATGTADKYKTSVTVAIKSDAPVNGEYIIEHAVLSADNGWTHTWTEQELPTFAGGSAEPITYTMTETRSDFYTGTAQTVTTTEENTTTYTTTFTNTPLRTVTVKKVWHAALRQIDAVTVTLTKNGTPVGEAVTLNSDNDYTYSFKGLEIYDTNGIEYTYAAAETAVSGYTPSYATENDVITITNRAVGSVTLTKVDANNDTVTLENAEFDLYRKLDTGDVKVPLTYSDSDGAYVEGDEDDAVKLTTNARGVIVVKNLEIGNYYFKETKAPDDYTLGSNTTTDFAVTESIPAAQVTVTNTATATATSEVTTTPTTEPGAAPEATLAPTDTPEASPEATLAPTTEPTTEPTATPAATKKPSSGGGGGGGSSVSTTTVTVEKQWEGDSEDTRPSEITVNLKNGDTIVKSQIIKATDNWKCTFKNLTKYSSGKLIEYTVEENPVDGYTPTYIETTTGYIIKNTFGASSTVDGPGLIGDGKNAATTPVGTSDNNAGGNGGRTVPRLNTDDHYAYVVGYPEGDVRPYGNITRAEVATIFFRLLEDESRDMFWKEDNDFNDVTIYNWYNKAVSTMENAGIVSGYEDGSFKPDMPIKRGEFAVIAAMFDSGKYEGEDKFTDISDHWSKEFVNRAAERGWISGYEDHTFKPEQYITRAEAMTLINNVLGRHVKAEDLHEDMIHWPDNSDADIWYYTAVQEATNSHEYEDIDDDFERWTKIIETKDWRTIEKPVEK